MLQNRSSVVLRSRELGMCRARAHGQIELPARPGRVAIRDADGDRNSNGKRRGGFDAYVGPGLMPVMHPRAGDTYTRMCDALPVPSMTSPARL